MSILSSFLRDFDFFKIKEEKSNVFAIYDNKLSKIYIKSKDSFVEEIYQYSLNYKNKDLSIIDEISMSGFKTSRNSSNENILYRYLQEKNGIKLIDNITFIPINQKIIENENGIFLNSYKATKYLDEKFNNGCKDSESFPNIRYLIMNLCANDKGAYEWFIKRLALTIREPKIKAQTYLVLQGEGASGKGTLFDLIMTPIFGNYIIIDTSQVLKTNFNDYTKERIWVVIEEKEDTGKKKDNIGSTIKYVTGNKKRVVEGKGKDRKEIEDFNNYIFTTNETNPGLDLKSHDRRASVFGYSRALGGHRNKAPEVRIKLEEEIPKELDDFVSYLKNLKFNKQEIFVSYETEARNNLVSLDVDNVGLFVEQIKSQYGESLFNYILQDIGMEFCEITFCEHKNETWILAKNIYMIYKKFSNINEKQITAENRFFPRFYNLTGLTPTEIKKNGRRLKYLSLKKLLEKFELKIQFETIVPSSNVQENIIKENISEITIDMEEALE